MSVAGMNLDRRLNGNWQAFVDGLSGAAAEAVARVQASVVLVESSRFRFGAGVIWGADGADRHQPAHPAAAAGCRSPWPTGGSTRRACRAGPPRRPGPAAGGG